MRTAGIATGSLLGTVFLVLVSLSTFGGVSDAEKFYFVNNQHRNPVVLRVLAASTGAKIVEDANVVSHVTFTDSGGNAVISDPYNTWTLNGTVPDQTLTPFYPTGFANSARVGAGAFSASNYYTAPSGSALAFASSSPFTVFVAYVTPNPGAAQDMVSTDNNGTVGWRLEIDASNNAYFQAGDGSNVHSAIASGAVFNGPNVVCGGYTGTQIFTSVNGGTAVTTTAGYSRDATDHPTIGQNAVIARAFGGQILEFYATTTAPTQGLCNQLTASYLGAIGTQQEQIALTNATSTTDTILTTSTTPPFLFIYAPDVLRVDDLGIDTEPASTNVNTYSRDLHSWPTTSNATATDNATGIDGVSTSAATVTSTVAGGYVQSATWTAVAGVYTISLYAKVSSGTQSFQFALRDITGSTSSCTGSHTATTTWQRFTCTTPSQTAGNTVGLRLLPGGAGTGTIIATAAQAEQQAWASSVIATSGAATTRNADQISLGTWSWGSPWSMGADVNELASTGSSQFVTQFENSGSDRGELYINSDNVECDFYNGTDYAATSPGAITAGTAAHVMCSYDGTNLKLCVNGTCTTTAKTFTAGASYGLYLGYEADGPVSYFNGRISNACFGVTAVSCDCESVGCH